MTIIFDNRTHSGLVKSRRQVGKITGFVSYLIIFPGDSNGPFNCKKRTSNWNKLQRQSTVSLKVFVYTRSVNVLISGHSARLILLKIKNIPDNPTHRPTLFLQCDKLLTADANSSTNQQSTNKRRWANAGLKLGQRRRRWTNLRSALAQRSVLTGRDDHWISASRPLAGRRAPHANHCARRISGS